MSKQSRTENQFQAEWLPFEFISGSEIQEELRLELEARNSIRHSWKIRLDFLINSHKCWRMTYKSSQYLESEQLKVPKWASISRTKLAGYGWNDHF